MGCVGRQVCPAVTYLKRLRAVQPPRHFDEENVNQLKKKRSEFREMLSKRFECPSHLVLDRLRCDF